MKNLLFKGFGLILIALLAVSCATVSNISVSNAGDPDALEQGAFIYALPQTVLDVQVTAEEVSIIPGPYEKYAEKYLGIQHAPAKPEKVYNLKNISLSGHLEADPDFIYTVSGLSDPGKFPGLTGLLKDSLILSGADFSGNQISSFIWPVQTGDVLYTDLSVKRNFEAEKDIEISMVLPDTDYVAPSRSARMVLKEKTPEQKAEEAANFLIKLKKRRFKLVAGQYDYMPDGESMSAALKELARIEEEYLSLFIGRKITTEIRRNFHFAPEAAENNNRVVLFRFSPSRGFIDATETDGIPVVIEMQPMNKLKELGRLKIPVRPRLNTIPYRIADQVNLRLIAGEQTWVEAIYPVFQLGSPVTMSVEN